MARQERRAGSLSADAGREAAWTVATSLLLEDTMGC